MNENLNLVNILKNCPEGTELYSPVFGDVEFVKVFPENFFLCPIQIKLKNNLFENLTKDGRLFGEYNGECMLFPSKEQRDWSKFKIKNSKKEYLVSPCEFNNGDILATNTGLQVFILQKAESGKRGNCYIGYDFGENMIFTAGSWRFVRLATEEEKQKLFDAIKLNGYKWNPETKTLEKLVKPKFKVGDKIVNSFRKYMGGSGYQGTISEITDDKYIFIEGSYIYIKNQGSWELAQDKKDKFDPKTLQPFDKVLGRNQKSQKWKCQLFSNIRKNTNYPYVCLGYYFRYCIPYNNNTKHLVSTTEEAPEYYRYWED